MKFNEDLSLLYNRRGRFMLSFWFQIDPAIPTFSLIRRINNEFLVFELLL